LSDFQIAITSLAGLASLLRRSLSYVSCVFLFPSAILTLSLTKFFASMNRKTDFLVVGSGIGGLSFALKVADYGKVILITKSALDDTNTAYAQGGIAAVTYSPDNTEKHVNDTLICGAGLCNEEVVRMVVTEAPEQIKELIRWGAKFDRNPDGQYDLAKEGGHSEHRILHHKDNTGAEIERALIRQVKANKNIEILENFFALELLTQHPLG